MDNKKPHQLPFLCFLSQQNLLKKLPLLSISTSSLRAIRNGLWVPPLHWSSILKVIDDPDFMKSQWSSLPDLTFSKNYFAASLDPTDDLKHLSLNDIPGSDLTGYTLSVASSFTRLLKPNVPQGPLLGSSLFSIYTPFLGDPI